MHRQYKKLTTVINSPGPSKGCVPPILVAARFGRVVCKVSIQSSNYLARYHRRGLLVLPMGGVGGVWAHSGTTHDQGPVVGRPRIVFFGQKAIIDEFATNSLCFWLACAAPATARALVSARALVTTANTRQTRQLSLMVIMYSGRPLQTDRVENEIFTACIGRPTTATEKMNHWRRGGVPKYPFHTRIMWMCIHNLCIIWLRGPIFSTDLGVLMYVVVDTQADPSKYKARTLSNMSLASATRESGPRLLVSDLQVH